MTTIDPFDLTPPVDRPAMPAPVRPGLHARYGGACSECGKPTDGLAELVDHVAYSCRPTKARRHLEVAA